MASRGPAARTLLAAGSRRSDGAQLCGSNIEGPRVCSAEEYWSLRNCNAIGIARYSKAKVARRNGGVADLSFAGTRRKPRVGGSAKDRCSSPASLANAYSHGSLERGADRASCSGPAIAALAMHEDGLRRGLTRVKARHLDGGASRSHGSHRQDGL